MKRSSLPSKKWLPVLALLCCAPNLATTVYRTVDENGVVSFSDTRPESEATVETLMIDSPAPEQSEVAQRRLQDMRETTDRMASDRMAREKHRAELRQLQAQTPAQYPPQYEQDYDPGYVGYSSGYSGRYNYPVRRNWKRRPRPHQPIARPPLRPPVQRDPAMPRTSLPGNDYPASLIRKSYNPRVRAALRN